MSKRILIEKTGEGTEIALMEENDLLFFSREKEAGPQAEQIYLGVVDRLARGMEAAFARLSANEAGFLPFSECKEKPKSGEHLLLQVKRPPVGEKAAYLTADIALAGRYCILTPYTPRIALSKRVEAAEERERMRALAEKHCPPQMGLVMRAESVGATDSEMAAEMAHLTEKWQNVLSLARESAAPCLVLGREDSLTRLLRDERGKIDEILTNAPDALPPLPNLARACENSFALYGVRAKLEKSLRRKVWLDCGGFLVIDRTEAMTVIDVNSGKFTGGKSGAEATFLKLNLEAAREIARLMRLRNIGGILLIDFVDMQSDESRAAVEDALREALRLDPVKTVMHGFTSLGLMELTRKKTEDFSSPLPLCPRCHGTGLNEDTVS